MAASSEAGLVRKNASISPYSSMPPTNTSRRLESYSVPSYTELHLKAALKDTLKAVGRDAPLLIGNDAQTLPWEDAAPAARL